MQGVNQVTIVGNVGSDPDYKDDAKTEILKFSVAVNTKWGDKEHVEWFNVVLFGGLAKALSAHVEKGKPVFVSGRLESRDYEDKDGNKRRWTDLIGETFRLLGEGGGSRDRGRDDDRGSDSRGRGDDRSRGNGGDRSAGNPFPRRGGR